MKAFGGDAVCDCVFLAQRGMLEEVWLETSPANFSGLPDETDKNKQQLQEGYGHNNRQYFLIATIDQT